MDGGTNIVQETGIKTIPKKKKCKKAKWLSGEALQIAVKRREVKSKGEKETHVYLWRIHFDIWQNSISLCPASFRIPRPNFPVTPAVS